jgi:hypothetical protein
MIKRLERLKNTVNKYVYGRLTTRSTYDLPVRTEADRKSTTWCTMFELYSLYKVKRRWWMKYV